MEIIDDLAVGGAQVLLAIRARNRHHMNCSIDIITLGNCSELLANQFATENIKVYQFDSSKVFDFRRLIGICRLLGKLKPDLIHSHLRTSNIVAAVCGWLMRIPTVATLHNIFPEPGLAHARRDWAEKWALRLFVENIIAVGPFVAQTHSPRFSNRKICVIPNPVEQQSIHPDTEGCRQQVRKSLRTPLELDDNPVILAVARLTAAKGVPQALQVVQELRNHIPNVKLLIAGDGELRQELEDFIVSNELQQTAALLGRSDQIPELMRASDVFLLLSSGEGLPLVVLEAMATSLPVVASRVGDVPWLLENGKAGVLVDWNDIPDTVEKVLELLNNPKRASVLTNRAQARVSQHFSVEFWLDAIHSAYQATVNRREASSVVVQDCVAHHHL